MDLQELISRGRFIFANARGRLKIFSLVNGRNSAKSIARRTRRQHSNTLNDLQKLRDVGLIELRHDKKGNPVKVDGSLVYQKVPLARHIPVSYFHGLTRVKKPSARPISAKATKRLAKAKPLPVPKEKEILDICGQGEDQTYEFKGPGAEARKITKEIAAFLNTTNGGIIFYGVDDDGAIVGTDLSRQKLDQSVHNSVRNSVSPAPNIHLRSTKVVGTEILLILIPPWNRRDVYTYEDRVLIRKGTNVFAATTEERKKLYKGIPVI